jgi:hypothetical protein
MEIRITHQGRVLADLEITQDAQLLVRSIPQAGPGSAAQYVWGATNSRPGGLNEQSITADCPSPVATGTERVPGKKVTDGLLSQG